MARTLLSSRGFPLGLAVGVVLSITAPARAQTPPEADAAALFDEGRKAWEEHRCDEGLSLLEQALAITGSPNARLYVARCLRDVGRVAEAYEEYGRVTREADALAAKEERYARTRDQAAAERAQLEPKIATLIIALDDSLAGSTVVLNGAPLAADRLGVPIASAPGRVVVVAQTPTGEVRREATLSAGTTQTITLVASAAPAPVEAAPVAPSPVEEPDSGGGDGTVRYVGIGLVGLGVVGLAVFGVGTAMAEGELSTLEDECGDGPCTDPKYTDTIDSGKRDEILATIGLGVGLAAIAAGIPMILFGGADGDESARVHVSPYGVTASYRERF